MAEHVLYKTSDFDEKFRINPEYTDPILDRNGEVVLALCKICGRGEIELVETPDCPGVPYKRDE